MHIYGEEISENYAEKINQAKIKYHGNCKCYIGNDLITVANSDGNGILFGYSNCSKESILMQAPWDMDSDTSSKSFSAIPDYWGSTRNGAQFLLPENMKNNTRHSHNETVSERLVYDEKTGKFKKDLPDFCVFIIEDGIDIDELEKKSNDSRIQKLSTKWEETKKAANQLNIPIVLIDREEFAKCEIDKINRLCDSFLGDKSNLYPTQAKLSDEEILEQIIVKFENNVTGSMFSSGTAKQLFSSSKRNQIFETVINKIDNLDDSNKLKYMNNLLEICTNEKSKALSINGKEVRSDSIDDDFVTFYDNKINELNEKVKKIKDDVKIIEPSQIAKFVFQDVLISSDEFDIEEKALIDLLKDNKKDEK